MPVKKEDGLIWTDPDDAPVLTDEFFDQAEIFEGPVFVQRKRGRPKIARPKEAVSLRLDYDVVENLRFSGPGWQSRVNEILRGYFHLEKPGS